MNPKPLSCAKNFTAPVAVISSSVDCDRIELPIVVLNIKDFPIRRSFPRARYSLVIWI